MAMVSNLLASPASGDTLTEHWIIETCYFVSNLLASPASGDCIQLIGKRIPAKFPIY